VFLVSISELRDFWVGHDGKSSPGALHEIQSAADPISSVLFGLWKKKF
jgi:hypothetical protein